MICTISIYILYRSMKPIRYDIHPTIEDLNELDVGNAVTIVLHSSPTSNDTVLAYVNYKFVGVNDESYYTFVSVKHFSKLKLNDNTIEDPQENHELYIDRLENNMQVKNIIKHPWNIP